MTISYDFGQEVTALKEELLGIDRQVPSEGILNLDEMAAFIEMINNNNVVTFNKYNGSAKAIKADELRFIHELIDEQVINTG